MHAVSHRYWGVGGLHTQEHCNFGYNEMVKRFCIDDAAALITPAILRCPCAVHYLAPQSLSSVHLSTQCSWAADWLSWAAQGQLIGGAVQAGQRSKPETIMSETLCSCPVDGTNAGLLAPQWCSR
jgi:hypothetical protein